MKRSTYYDKETDIKWIVLAEGEESYSEELAPNVLGEYDANHQLIGIEIQNASRVQIIHNFTLNSSSDERIFVHSQNDPSIKPIILSQDSDKRRSGVTL